MHESSHLSLAVEKHKGVISAERAKPDQYLKTTHAAESLSLNVGSESTLGNGLQNKCSIAHFPF